jgi:4-aminobutyrate aminotransferase-like enzyme
LIRQGVVCNLVGEGRVLKITPPVLIDDDDFEFGTRAIEKTILKFNK